MIRRGALILGIAMIAFSFAQSTFGQTSANDVAILLSPQNPGAYENVTVSLQSYSMDLTTANIEWTQDGKHVSGGIGKKDYTFTTKAIGVATTIVATITQAGTVLPLTKQAVITPVGIDLLWQAPDSAVPPLYRGKAMPSSEARIKFVAIPQIKTSGGALASSGQFIYSWSDNYQDSPDDSGYGKNTFSILASNLNQFEHIAVTAESRDSTVTADASADIATGNPKILWYASSPLYGPNFDRVLDPSGASVLGSDTSLFAEPYFFSPRDLTSSTLSYEWQINGQSIDTPAIPNTIFLHRDDPNATGTATVDLSITNINRLFQQATGHLTLTLQ